MVFEIRKKRSGGSNAAFVWLSQGTCQPTGRDLRQWSGRLAILGSLLLCAGCQAIVSKVYLPQKDVRKADHGVRIERRAAMTTRDGVELVSYVYLPKTNEKTPTILVRIPFLKTYVNKIGADAIGRFWAKRGYAVVIQGTRGRFLSSGRFYPLRTEREDGIETLQWLTKQSWYNGRIGMWGGSTFGYTQWVLADQKDPGPSAFDIQISSTSFYDMFYPGGAFSLESALFWAVREHSQRQQWSPFEALVPGFEGFPLIEADDRAVGDIPYFNDWVTHVEKDSYWIEIDGQDRPRNLKAPALLMAGWYDPFLPSQIDDFMRVRNEADPAVAAATRLVIGPWGHARTVKLAGGFTPRSYRKESLRPSIAWFDRHLRMDSTISETAPVRIFVIGDNIWRDEQQWPLARTRYVPYYLHSGGKANGATGNGLLTTEPPSSAEPTDTYIYDPKDPVPSAGGTTIGPRAGVARQNEIETRSDVLVYTTLPLDEDVEVTGPITLVLYVSTTAANTDFTGKLVDVHPDGKAFNVCDGILRRNYNDSVGKTKRDKPTEITIQLWPTSMVFHAGHRIRLEVSSSNFPRYDRNPNTGGNIPRETQPIPATQTIHHGVASPSHLILPIIPR